jgi:hypothetical protein
MIIHGEAELLDLLERVDTRRDKMKKTGVDGVVSSNDFSTYFRPQLLFDEQTCFSKRLRIV